MDSIRKVTVSWSLASRKAPLWIRRQPMMLVAHVGGCRGPLRVINRDANHDQDHFIQFTALVDFCLSLLPVSSLSSSSKA